MKKLFLCSSFKDVAPLFKEFIKGDLVGKKVSFIPTASLVEEVTFYVKAGRKSLEKMGLIIDELDISSATTDEIMRRFRCRATAVRRPGRPRGTAVRSSGGLPRQGGRSVTGKNYFAA